MTSSVKVLIVGAGVVGASTAYHLSQLGWTDILVIDQGRLYATGGSSSHAPGLVFQTNPSKTMTELARYTVELYSGLELDGQPCFHSVGGIEVAATPERWHDLKRKHGLATSWGVDAELVAPDEVARRIPILAPGRIHGGLYVPTDGIAKSVLAVEAMCRAAERRGVAFRGSTEVTGFDIADGRVRAVETTQGRIETETVVCCAGIWGPKVGRLAGVSIPVQPLAHQYALTTQVPELAGATQEVEHPILRHQDSSMYFRQVGDCYGVGSYQHRSMPVSAEDILSASHGHRFAMATPGNCENRSAGSAIHESASHGHRFAMATPGNCENRSAGSAIHESGAQAPLMPSVMAFTEDDFKQPWQDALELLPPLRQTTLADAMNGLFLFTNDGGPMLGESRQVRGFWVAEAVWVTHSGGVGRVIAEWLVEGKPSIDVRECDLHRLEDFQHSPAYVLARGSQNFQEVYDIIHPLQPMEQPRPLRTSPFHPRQQDLQAVFLEASGWERPQWFESNAALPGGQDIPARDAWAARYWSPLVGVEHLATRERVALYDMTPLKKLEVVGPGALSFLQSLTSNQIDRPPGYVTYTLMLDERGGIRSDLTVARLGEDHFQIGANGPLDVDWMQRHLPDDGSVQIRDITGATCCVGLWGPNARRVLERLTDDDVSHTGFGFFKARQIFVREVPVTALRLSYVGELGWELYTSAEFGLRLWDLLWEAGQPLGILAGGRGAFNALRLEKGYRSWGTDMWADHNPYEAGLGFAVRMDKGDFVGRTALERAARQPARKLTCLTLADPASLVLGKEPVFCDGRPVGFVTSAAHGYSVQESIAYAWLPEECTRNGAGLEIAYFGERYAARVAPDPLFDPRMHRMRS